MNEESVFVAALEMPTAAERQAFLDEACAHDGALRRRVKRLLAAHVQPSGILDHPDGRPDWTDVTAAFVPAGLNSNERVGTIVAGRYKLLEEIGAGGMGTVWRAEQIQPVRRLVALKLIKAGMDSQTVLSRFEAERQALAMMEHPNIARVLDGGTTENGRPYFVMEYVKGVPLTRYCDEARLTIAERLALFVPVCQAVQHAHTKGVIHRDLKPGNILVCLYDGRPVPKVIDFGLAKAIQEPLTDAHAAHRSRRAGGHATLHESRAGRIQQSRCGRSYGRLRPGRDPVRAADRDDAARSAAHPADPMDRAPPSHQGGGPATTERPA